MKKQQTRQSSGEEQKQALYEGFTHHLPHVMEGPMPSIWPPRQMKLYVEKAPEPALELLEPELVDA
ncbi:hypothetical protein [Calidithermus chliarophilus]|uniref:hypothetical protein n=1 Tax=Calidithermus chliarophilus TaxID=52023 RepID=UPI0004129336|nr:hypothetical protein [Calidithermus chliarophilus]